MILPVVNEGQLIPASSREETEEIIRKDKIRKGIESDSEKKEKSEVLFVMTGDNVSSVFIDFSSILYTFNEHS